MKGISQKEERKKEGKTVKYNKKKEVRKNVKEAVRQ